MLFDHFINIIENALFIYLKLFSIFSRHAKNEGSSKKTIIKIHEERTSTEYKEKIISAIPRVFMDPEKVYILIGKLNITKEFINLFIFCHDNILLHFIFLLGHNF